jgi:hypothetical protein
MHLSKSFNSKKTVALLLRKSTSSGFRVIASS